MFLCTGSTKNCIQVGELNFCHHHPTSSISGYFIYIGQESDTYKSRNMFPPYLGIRVLSNFLTCDYFRCFFIQIRTTPVSADIAKYVVGHFNFCHTIMPCRTFRHSDLVADRHCLKFHRRFCSDESSRSCCKCVTGATSPSYTICIVLIHSLR